MPAQRPCAAFEPIAPDLDLSELVESTPNFEFVVRIHCSAIEEQGIEKFEKLVLLHVIIGGKPLVIEGYNERLEGWIFAVQWLRDNYATKIENARNLTTKSNLPLSIGHYLNNMALLTDQWTAHNYKDTNRQRIYLKDIDCPQTWHDKLRDLLPPVLFYLNESTGDIGGPGAILTPNLHSTGCRAGKGVSKAGDLMSSLPSEMRAENLMCYIGHEGTYTPSHREMCASLGHNIMVETSTGQIENGKPTKPGSSIWFMTETGDRRVVSEYWLSKLGHDIEIEQHFAQINAWKSAPFKTWVVDQKVGDFILIPPLAPHQVWNRGTRTMKVAWNRTTVETLEMALNEALPHARMVCRDEQYKNKAIVYYTLEKYSQLLERVDSQGLNSLKIRQLQKDFKRIFALFTVVLLSESFSRDLPEPRQVDLLPFDSNVTCAYCRCNVFNRFLTCPICIGKLHTGEDDNYDICMECYAMGRSCACISKLKWVEQFKWKELVQTHERWKNQIIHFEGRIDDLSPESLPVEQEKLGKKTLAAICQEELKRRPWTDITKPPVREAENEEAVDVDDEGRIRKRRKIRRSEKWRKEHASCHICKTPEPTWRLATCSTCTLSYCYGSLFRAFDIMPRTAMESHKWKCPKCRKICTCGTCRRDPSMKPFEPTGTLLGHDTRKIADPRSVESLVDFSHSNITWLKKAGDDHPHDTRRLKRRQEEAEKAKSKEATLNEHYVESADTQPVGDVMTPTEYDGIPIDPALGDSYYGQLPDDVNGYGAQDYYTNTESMLYASRQPLFTVPDNGVFRGDMVDEYEQNEAITFEYPDPDALQGSNLPPELQDQSALERPGLETDETVDEFANGQQNRSTEHTWRRNAFNMTFDGAADVPTGLPNPQPYRAGTKSLIVKLRVSRAVLLTLPERSLSSTGRRRGADPSTTILQSDLASIDPLLATTRSHIKPKKSHPTREEDDDFTPRKLHTGMTDGSSRRVRKMNSTRPAESGGSGEEVTDVNIPLQKPIKRNPPRRSAQRRSMNPGSGPSTALDLDDDAANESPPPPLPNDNSEDIFDAVNNDDSARLQETVLEDDISREVVSNGSKEIRLDATNESEDSEEDVANLPQRTRQQSTESSQQISDEGGVNANAEEHERPTNRPRQLTKAEENRRAKLMAMQWAEGDFGDLDNGSWTGSEPGSSEAHTRTVDSEQPDILDTVPLGEQPIVFNKPTGAGEGPTTTRTKPRTPIAETYDSSETSSESGGEIPATPRADPKAQQPPKLWVPMNKKAEKGRSNVAKRGARRSNRQKAT